MKLHTVSTCPIWDGNEIGIEPCLRPRSVIGWCNVLDITIQGQRVRLLAA